MSSSLAESYRRAQSLAGDPRKQEITRRHCATHPADFIDDWCWSFDPRRVAEHEKSAYVPLNLWPRQREFIDWLDNRVTDRDDGLVEKSRDVGITYLLAAFALNKWLYVPGFKSTFGSRKEDLVDKIGDPDSIFEKIRIMLRWLPKWMRPTDFAWKQHAMHLRMVNPENGNVITGEAGENMGRGGRASLYVVDEAAFIEHPESMDGATSAVADTRIFASSVNGIGNWFYKKRHAKATKVFVFDWRDDPRKTPAWAAKKQADLDADVWAREYERDYAASIEGICIPGKWVKAAADLFGMVDLTDGLPRHAGLDVGGGKAKSVLIIRKGHVIKPAIAWLKPDTIDTAHKAMDAAKDNGINALFYDAPGVGAGVAAVFNRFEDEESAPERKLVIRPVNTGIPPTETLWPDGRTAKQRFANLKAELWWTAKQYFKRSYEHWLFVTGQDGGVEHDLCDIVVIDPEENDLMSQLSIPRSFRSETGKIMLETKKQLSGRGISSPDYADAFVLAFMQETSLDMDEGEIRIGPKLSTRRGADF